MTAAFDEQEFGAGLDLFSKLKLLAEWAPLLNRLQMVALAKEPHDQALAVVSALQWAAGKSATEIDDQALNWVVGKIGGAV
jgi:prephenate dehydrogenase